MSVRRLRPIAARRGLRITLAALLLPAVGIITLAQVESVRRPLAEPEAILAIAVRSPGGNADLRAPAVRGADATPSRSAVALTSLGPMLLGTSELALRAAGIAAGALALGATVQLGERLFATRVGVIAAGLLLAAPEGRAILGTQLTADPFYLLTMLICLTSIRNLARAKRSAVHAGISGGLAIALVGGAALWLPALGLIWLRRLRGLDPGSFATFIGWTTASVGGAAVLALALVGWDPASGLGVASAAFAEEISPGLLVLGFLPIVPLAVVGAWHLPPRWPRSESLRFLGWWLATATTAALLTGSIIGSATALLFLAAALAAWALDRARRPLRLGAIAAAAALFVAVPKEAPPRADDLEPWAARETARFVKHVLPREGRVAAAEGAAGRIAYYSRRDIAALADVADVAAANYVVVDRPELRRLGATLRENDRVVLLGDASMRVLAEFGPWIVARVGAPEGPAEGGPGGPSEAPRPTGFSP